MKIAGIEGRAGAAAEKRSRGGTGRNCGRASSLWNETLCFQCGACLSICPANVFRRDADWRVTADHALCNNCGRCDGVCPAGALTSNRGAP